MKLEKGSHLGPYEIEDLIGEGGMGQVYRARDPRLERTVAVKILLPGERNQHRHERFEIEARAVARLAHPHICTLYDVGREGEQVYLVMEYVDGLPLGQGEGSGASQGGGSLSGTHSRLSLARTLEYASQIASALSEAHRHGIVHRDLKPANILVGRSGVKLLDFGLAKTHNAVSTDSGSGAGIRGDSASGPRSEAPTKASLTGRTAIVGTLTYMAPEQIQGRPVDARTDIFALGVILYELIGGARPFAADSEAGLLAAILEREPPSLDVVRPEVPPRLVRLVDACLAKDPERRWQSAGDLARELQWILQELRTPADGGAARSRTRLRRALNLALVLAVGCIGALVSILWGRTPPRATAGDPVQLTLPVHAMWRPAAFSISPDGRVLAYLDEGSDRRNRLVLYRLDTGETTDVPGSESAGISFWSPDSRFLVFSTAEALLRVDIQNLTQPAKITTVVGTMRGGTWGSAGTILFSDRHDMLYRVSAEGGEPTPAFPDDKRRIRPTFLPDGRRFLFINPDSEPGVMLGSLDGAPPRQLLAGVGAAQWTDNGFLLFTRNNSLVARRFDAATGVVSPGEILVVTGSDVLRAEHFSTSRNGVLVYRKTGSERRRFLWLNRKGEELGQVMSVDTWRGFDLSRDGTKIIAEKVKRELDLWLLDLSRETQMLVVDDTAPAGNPIWDNTGDFFYYDVWGRDLLKRAVAGGTPEGLFEGSGESMVFSEDASPDGHWLAMGNFRPGQGQRGILLDLRDLTQTHPFGEDAESIDETHFAPDSRWMAYNARYQGIMEVYMAPVPPSGQRWQVSSGGGVEPRFRADGKELFYLNLEGKLMSVRVNLQGKTPILEPPSALFDSGIARPDGSLDHYAVAPDGQRFLVLRNVDNFHASPLRVIVNWTQLHGSDQGATHNSSMKP